MGNVIIWPVDRAAKEDATADGSTQGITADGTGAAFAVDLDQKSFLEMNDGANVDIDFNLGTGTARNIVAVGLGNCFNMAGESIELAYTSTWLGTRTVIASGVMPGQEDPSIGTDLIIADTAGPGDKQFWNVRITTSINTDRKIGTVSLLDDDYGLTLNSAGGKGSPAFPMNRDLTPGYILRDTPGGQPDFQHLGGTQEQWGFSIRYALSDASTDLWAVAMASWRLTDGWAKGVWFKLDNEEDSGTIDTARYAYPIAPLGSPITHPGGYVTGGISLATFPKGRLVQMV